MHNYRLRLSIVGECMTVAHTHFEAGGIENQGVEVELWSIQVAVRPRPHLKSHLLQSSSCSSHSRRLGEDRVLALSRRTGGLLADLDER